MSVGSIPHFVPKLLRDEIEKHQRQIRILLNNHKILNSKLKQDPENPLLKLQIERVKEYLYHFSQEQEIVVNKVRQFLRDIEDGKYDQPRTYANHERELETPPDLESDKSVTPDADLKGSDTPNRPSPRGRKRKRDSVDSTRVNSPQDSDEEDSVYLRYLEDNLSTYRGHVETYEVPRPTISQLHRQSNGMLVTADQDDSRAISKDKEDSSSDDKASYSNSPDDSEADATFDYAEKELEFIDEDETKKYNSQEPDSNLSEADKVQRDLRLLTNSCGRGQPADPTRQHKFMGLLDLLTPTCLDSVVKIQEERRAKSMHRLSLYIPEVSDKKLRYDHYLKTSIFSPPHLRSTRHTGAQEGGAKLRPGGGRGGGGVGGRGSRGGRGSTGKSTGRGKHVPAPVERMGTRRHLLQKQKEGVEAVKQEQEAQSASVQIRSALVVKIKRCRDPGSQSCSP